MSDHPGVALLDHLAEHLADRIAERLLERHADSPRPPGVAASLEGSDLQALGFELMRVYSAKEVAGLLGTRRVSSVYEIPEAVLPRVRRIGSGVGFLGLNVLCYMHRLPPVDVAAYLDHCRVQLMQQPRPRLQVLDKQKPGKTRLL